MTKFKRITSKIEWEDLFNKALFKTFFHQLDWHEFLEKEFKWLKFEYYLYKDEAILPLARFRVFGKEKLISLPFCEYGGLLPLKKEIDFNEFKKDILSKFGENIKIKFHPEILKYFHFGELGIKNYELGSDIFTSWIENFKNTNEEELLSSFRKTLRYEVRDAQNENSTVKKCENLKELKQFYGLYIANLKRKKTVPYPFSVIEFLCKNESAELLLAIYAGRVVAGDLFLNYGKFVHYFLNASNYRYKDLGTNYLLLWNKIKSLIGQDKILDLGATPKGSSLDIFKRGWGGKECPIFILENKKNSEGLRSSKLRNIWGLLPNFIIKGLSSRLIKYRL